MNIPELIKDAHQNAIDKGFYDCPDCEGTGEVWVINKGSLVCKNCKHTGINPNKNIGELLMLIVSELGEALEAHRKGKFSKKEYNLMSGKIVDCTGLGNSDFIHWVKDTFEDEIADVFIRLFDLCCYLKIEINHAGRYTAKFGDMNIGEFLMAATGAIHGIYVSYINKSSPTKEMIQNTFRFLMSFCIDADIPIEKHILAKMAYNKTREHKHGKEY